MDWPAEGPAPHTGLVTRLSDHKSNAAASLNLRRRGAAMTATPDRPARQTDRIARSQGKD
jgi:hypothetical protein